MSWACLLTCYWDWIGDKHKADSHPESLGQHHKIPVHISRSGDQRYYAGNSAEEGDRIDCIDNYKKADNILFPALGIQTYLDL